MAPRKPKASPKAKQAKAKPKTKTQQQKDDIKARITPEPSEELDALLKRYHGRPSKYDPSFCACVVAWGRLGKSKTWMAAEMMVTRNTLDNWATENPEFLSALTLAKHLEQQYWEDRGDNLMTTTGFAQNCWGRNMAARFPQEWREKLAITDPEGGAFKVQFVQ